MPHILDEELYQAGMAIAACPTAPCHEGHVIACLLERLRDLPYITTRQDEFGNLHVSYEFESAGREPFRVVAHMDHPAVVVQGDELHFAGGVDEGYFAGQSLVFYSSQSREPLGRARIASIAFSDEVKRVQIDGSIPVDATFATWDLPPPACTKTRFVSPACDDLAQVSLVLAVLRRLSLSGARASFHALFTRAEEIGFAGALASLKAKEPLSAIPTLSLETSNARGFAELDAGAIVRVGDRMSVFDSRITHWMETAFRDLQVAKPGTTYQRLLMGGGTCEATVFHRAGLPTGALCVAMENYHNMGPDRSVASEAISLRDWQGLYDFLFFLATEAKSVQAADAGVEARLSKLQAKAVATLRPLS